jgi:DNA-binding transcriptional ArsR family regulator
MSKITEKPEQSKLLKIIDEEAFKLVGDETRRRIIFLLRDNEFTAKEIASQLNLTPQNIYHHIKKLQDAGLVKVSEEKRSGHLIESYYTTTADTFVYHADEMVEKSIQSAIHVLNGLNEMGVSVEVDEESAGKISELQEQRARSPNVPLVTNGICSACSFSGYFMKFGPMNPVLLERILRYANLMKMTDEEFEESLKLTRKMRRLLLSIRMQTRPAHTWQNRSNSHVSSKSREYMKARNVWKSAMKVDACPKN